MKIRSGQRGFALLILLALMTTASAALAVKMAKNNDSNIQITRDALTIKAMAQAKDALTGYAITFADTHPGMVPGYLPCPDQAGGNPEGSAELDCGTRDISATGRLPWRTLDLSPLRGGDNECLWYAVSGTYKNNIKTGLMNEDTNGQLKVYAADGALLTPADNQAAAVIFAPGKTLPGQSRSSTTTSLCNDNYTAGGYLDSDGTYDNATVSITPGAASSFRQGNTAQINDQMIFITRADIWNALKRRSDFLATLDDMTLKTAQCIAEYGRRNNFPSNRSLPWPAPVSLSDYTNNTQYNDTDNLLVGRVPYRVNTSRSATGNSILTPYYLLQANGANCPNPAGWAAIYPWWDNWKDHLFYAISKRFKPDNAATSACDSGSCLSLNTSANNNAAVVIFSGEKLTGQNRTDKSVVSAYLEGRNASNTAHPSGNENYQMDAAGDTFNDIVYCIKDDLSVVRGTTTGCP
ncbi:MAG: hypothetical protein PHP85_04925 [Gallionella sp.]|nr:hypothetical protein [Gallionella sp.]